MNKALIEIATGRCVNIIVEGDDYVPPAGHELQTANDARKNKIWNGTGYDPIPDQVFEDAAVKAIDGFSPEMRTVAEALWQIGKAAKTNDFSAFQLADGTPVTTKTLFNAWLKEILRSFE